MLISGAIVCKYIYIYIYIYTVYIYIYTHVYVYVYIYIYIYIGFVVIDSRMLYCKKGHFISEKLIIIV